METGNETKVNATMKSADMKSGKIKKIIISLGIAILVLMILTILFNLKKNSEKKKVGLPYSNEYFEIDIDDPAYNASTPIESGNFEQVEMAEVGKVTIIAPGANPINEDNIVLLNNGQVAQNTGIRAGKDAPKQTGFLTPEELGKEVFQLKVSSVGFKPNQFTTVASAPTTFSLTSTDDLVHTFVFDHRDLSSISISVGPYQTKAITFQAPATPGIYNFKCISPGHDDKVEAGQLIVK